MDKTKKATFTSQNEFRTSALSSLPTPLRRQDIRREGALRRLHATIQRYVAALDEKPYPQAVIDIALMRTIPYEEAVRILEQKTVRLHQDFLGTLKNFNQVGKRVPA